MRNYLNPHNIEPFIPTKNAEDGTENGTNARDINVRSKMTTAEAIRILENIETDIYGRIAVGKAIDALQSPWVKTSDRLPTEADAPRGVVLISGYHNWYSVQAPKTLELYPQYYPYWMPIPPLPEPGVWM